MWRRVEGGIGTCLVMRLMHDGAAGDRRPDAAAIVNRKLRMLVPVDKIVMVG